MSIYKVTSYIFVLLFIASCGNSEHVSEYKTDDSKYSFLLKLVHDHPYLEEYKRQIVVFENGNKIAAQELFSDTGGYANTNLYSCSSNRYLVLGYFDSW